MTHELILTSVSQGLEPGDRGFCPVAESAALPPQLLADLQSISGYRHLYVQETDDAVHNPIAYSHLTVPTDDQAVHVLSRIADSGTDFQHEPNRLAHHVAFTSEEQVPEGPAWILAQSGFHFAQWLSPAVRFVQGRPLPTLTAPPPLNRLQQIDREHRRLDAQKMDPFVGAPPPETTELPPLNNTPCPFWQLLTGDAGWGGVLAATIRSARPTAIIFRPGTNVLPLFVESLALIPPAMRWKATFSTYYTNYPDHIDCQWMAVPVDSPEAQRLRENPAVLLIDLTTSLDKAPNGPYVEFARHGAEQTLPANEMYADLFEDVPDILDDLAISPAPTIVMNPEPVPDSPPPTVAVPPIQIRTSSQKTPSAVESFLNMKSRGTFYTIVCATLLCVIALSAVVLDQIFGLGLLQSPPPKPNVPVAVPQNGKPPVDPPDPAAVDVENQQAVEHERFEQQREAAEQEREKLQAEAEEFLDRFRAPNNLSLHVPVPEDPETTQRFTELAGLHPYGSVIHFKIVPILRSPGLIIETIKQPDELADDAPGFEWIVFGTYTVNGQQFPLLQLTLMPDGLSVDWLEDALSPQFFNVVALLRFGFLRFGIEDAEDRTGVPLFITKTEKPIHPGEVFGDTDELTFNVPTPLADEPYQDIFEGRDVYYSLRLDVVVHPETLSDTVTIARKSPTEFLVDVETSVESKRTEESGTDSFHPITVSFAAIAEAERIRWIDRYSDQREMLDTERKGNQTRIEEIGKELNDIGQRFLRQEGTAADSRRRDELGTVRRRLENRDKEIDDILSKLSDARDSVVNNADFRFEYSLFLLPRAGIEDVDSPLLPSEEAVPISTGTVNGE